MHSSCVDFSSIFLYCNISYIHPATGTFVQENSNHSRHRRLGLGAALGGPGQGEDRYEEVLVI